MEPTIIIKKFQNYLEKNYSAEIVLVNVLSPSLMAHIFNTRMFIPEVDYSKYLKHIRMDHARA